MKNKIKLKRLLKVIVILLFISTCFFIGLTRYEYHVYTLNFNRKIDNIIIKVREKYPNVTKDEIMDIVNDSLDDNSNLESLFEEYGIYIDKDSILIENDIKYHRYLIINTLFFIAIMIILIYLFLRYDRNKDREIASITKYIENINRKNYTLNIDEISEDELSILKNEIYKTTILLKESAENSIKDKKELKKSLEDISHQLKTPLTSILVMLDNIIDDANMDNNVKEEFIKDIKREVGSINFLVQSILKLSKFDVNTVSYIKEETSINNIIKEAVKNVSVLSDLKNIDININGDINIKIRCDFNWQVEAITNIIKNSLEHSKDNDKIDISYDENNVYSSIVIKDYGNGIDSQDLPHIFERFYKGKKASNDSIGIGLALSKKIIEKDNGTINVESNENGTKFIIKYFNL